MDEQLYKKIEDLEFKINEIYKTTKAIKKIFVWSGILSIFLFLIPLIILMFLLPSMLETISGAYSGLL